jgi:hypothetical protein
MKRIQLLLLLLLLQNIAVLGNIYSDTSPCFTLNIPSDSLSEKIKIIHKRFIAAGLKLLEKDSSKQYIARNGIAIIDLKNDSLIVIGTKGSFPNPLIYLDSLYILNHINQFKQQGASFIIVKSWTENGRFRTLPAYKFVGLTSVMDEVISKYKSEGNDWKVLRDNLNLGQTTDLTNEEIYYIKIAGDDSRFTFVMPTGNEVGAITGEWLPCGYTKNGIPEASLAGSEQVIHNQDITQLLNYFEGKWEKIK